MATFDISRVAFDPQKHFTSVRMQQGRVLTDDDWNENERIENEDTRRSRVDIIGAFGSPNAGFHIENLVVNGDGTLDFDIHNGTLYLGGLRLEMDALEKYLLQNDWLSQNPTERLAPKNLIANEQFDLVYIEAKQQAICAVEDSSLFEVALGGPDTTTRIRNMRQVKLARNIGFPNCADAWQQLVQNWEKDRLGKVNEQYERIRDVRLTVSFTNTVLAEDLCTPSVSGGYLGAENQAIRVQLTDTNKFTWGFDNAAPLYRVTTALVSGVTQITMLTQPKDQYHYPLAGQVVEILPWSAVLPNKEKIAAQSGFLSKVAASYDPDTHVFSLATALPANFGEEWKNRTDKPQLSEPEEFYYLRLWHRGTDQTTPTEIPFTVGTPVPLGNTGLQIRIDGTDTVKEDYWVIAARPETPNRVVPWELETGIPPHGVRRFFAPLAVIQWSRDANQKIVGKIIHDCRKPFRPLTDQECCCTYTVGDGINSKGDYNSIQEAVDNLPDEGGKICVLRGIHEANVMIKERQQIRITGCGEHSIIHPLISDRTRKQPIFTIISSEKIEIDNLLLVAVEGTAIQVTDLLNNPIVVLGIHIHHNHIIALIHAINVALHPNQAGSNDIWIAYNLIAMLDKEGGKAAIFSLADDVLIERNKIVLIPAPRQEEPPGVRTPPTPPLVFDPCFNPKHLYGLGNKLRPVVSAVFKYVKSLAVIVIKTPTYQAMGGIQIGGTSERVKIAQNTIIGGKSNGVTLGHLVQDVTLSTHIIASEITLRAFAAVVINVNNALYEIAIEDNHIQDMGLSGIGAVVYSEDKNRVHVEDLIVYRNTIRHCAIQLPAVTDNNKTILKSIGFGGISLTFCENAVIQENRIEENGLGAPQAVCGIFIMHGDRIDISDNRIINNGEIDITGKIPTREGQRGGIVIKMALKGADLKQLLATQTPSFDGIPTVKVHNNIISQPLGHALFLLAFGPISVVGNQMTSQGIDRTNIFSLIAGSVFIVNLGVSKDLLLFNILAKFSNMGETAPTTGRSSNPILNALQFLPNGKTLFVGNQTTLDLRSADSSIAISSQLIASLDDVAFNSNETECAAFTSTQAKTFDIVYINTLLAAFSLRANDNRFSEGFTLSMLSLVSLGLMNTAVSNQSTHCLIVLGPIPSFVTKANNTTLISSTQCDGINQQFKGRLKLG